MKKVANKNLDFEINLLPVISILAVCISFLLLTTVWVRVGTFDLSQALGTESTSASEKKPEIWVTFENSGSLMLTVKNAPQLKQKLQLLSISNKAGNVQIAAVEKYVTEIKQQVPDLQTGLMLPAPQTSYSDLIAVMDTLKKQKVLNLGIAPL